MKKPILQANTLEISWPGHPSRPTKDGGRDSASSAASRRRPLWGEAGLRVLLGFGGGGEGGGARVEVVSGLVA